MLTRVLTYSALTAFWVILLGGGSEALGLPVALGLPQLAPGIAGLLTLLIFRKDGLRISLLRRDIPAARYLAAIGIPFGMGLLIFGVSLAVFPQLTSGSIGIGISALSLLWMPFGAIGEELGWRGYLNKRLARGTAGLAAAAITGLLWTLLHVHFFANGPLYMLFAALSFVAMSVVIHVIVAEHDFNVALSALFHLGVNLSSALSWPVINEIGFMAGYALLWATAALAAALLRRDLLLSPDKRAYPGG